MKRPLRILLVEDILLDAELVERELRKASLTFTSLRVDTREAFEKHVVAFDPDIILADYSLPQFTALDALQMMKQHGLDIPFLLVTGAQSEEVAVACMKEGADDYILKTSLTRLPTAVQNALGKKKAEREREKAENALVQHEQQFRALIENALDIITVLSEQFTVLYASPSVERVLGYTPEELENRSVMDFVRLEDLGIIRTIFSDLAGNPGMQKIAEFHIRHKDASWRTLEAVGRFLGEESAIRGVIINARDVTERKRVEVQNAALSILGQRLSSASTAEAAARIIVEIADTLFGWDACSLDLYFPETGIILPVLTMDLLNGKRVDVPSVYRSTSPSPMALSTLRDGGKLILRDPEKAMETTLTPFGDTTRTSASLLFVPIRNGESAIGILSIQSYTPYAYEEQDLQTLQALADHCGGALERIRAEKALRDSEERYRVMAEQTGQLVYDYDVQTGIILWSGAIEEITGFPDVEFRRVDLKGWEGLIHPEDRTLALLLLGEAMNTAGQFNVEYRFRRKDGSYIHIEDNGIFLHNELGQSTRMLGTMKDITERKRSQVALRQSEERFRRLAENAQDVIYRLRLGGDPRFEYLSPAITVVTGYSPDEFYTDPQLGLKIVHPEDLPFLDVLSASGTGDFGTPAIMRWIRKDGSIVWIEQRNVPIFDQAGDLVAVEGIARDITERKRAEEALRESEERYRVVAETASDGIITTDEHGKILFVNSATENIFGYPVSDMLGKDIGLLIPAFLHHVRQSPPTVAPGAGMRTGWEATELAGIHRNAGKIPLELSFAEFMKHGTRFFTGIVRDITERKRAEEALRRSEEQYRHFFEDDLTGDYIATANGRILACNPAFVRMFGFSSIEEALATNIDSIYPGPNDRKTLIRLLERERKLEYHELELKRVDGSPVYVIQNAIGKFSDRGELIELKGYLFDNTERKKLEGQLHQAQKMDSIGTMASGIAHDFNNILNNILGFAMQLKKYTNNEVKVLKYSETIEKSALRGAELANQLLSFVRHKKRQNVPTTIADIVDEVVALCGETFPKSIAIEKTVDSMLFPVMGDKGELYQVLLNLMVNARDAMADGGSISIQAMNRVVGREVSPKLLSTEAAYCIELRVSDTGAGIPEHLMDRIFDPFFTTKDKGMGTGLGLSIVFKIIRNHHGSIMVDSTVGRGTTFSIYLPALEAVEQPVTDSEEPGVVGSNNELVLFVDDDEPTRELARELLEEQGYKVLLAGDGDIAIDIYRQQAQEIALVILDLVMPRMDGGRTYVEMKKVNSSIRAFFCTGHTSSELITTLLAEEDLRALQKPFRSEDFLRTVREVLDRQPSLR
jgi:two-component system cell cycle sensor histidine kinase/response regulator CckA